MNTIRISRDGKPARVLKMRDVSSSLPVWPRAYISATVGGSTSFTINKGIATKVTSLEAMPYSATSSSKAPKIQMSADSSTNEVRAMAKNGMASSSTSLALTDSSSCVPSEEPSEETLPYNSHSDSTTLAEPEPMETNRTVARLVSALLTHSRARMPSNKTLIITPPLLPPVAKPPSRVAKRMSWKPRKVSAVISWTTAIAIQPAISPVTPTRSEEYWGWNSSPTRSPANR